MIPLLQPCDAFDAKMTCQLLNNQVWFDTGWKGFRSEIYSKMRLLFDYVQGWSGGTILESISPLFDSNMHIDIEEESFWFNFFLCVQEAKKETGYMKTSHTVKNDVSEWFAVS